MRARFLAALALSSGVGPLRAIHAKRPPTDWAEKAELRESHENADNAETAEANDPIEAKDAADPTERADADDPIDSTEFTEPIDSTELRDPTDNMEGIRRLFSDAASKMHRGRSWFATIASQSASGIRPLRLIVYRE